MTGQGKAWLGGLRTPEGASGQIARGTSFIPSFTNILSFGLTDTSLSALLQKKSC